MMPLYSLMVGVGVTHRRHYMVGPGSFGENRSIGGDVGDGLHVKIQLSVSPSPLLKCAQTSASLMVLGSFDLKGMMINTGI